MQENHKFKICRFLLPYIAELLLFLKNCTLTHSNISLNFVLPILQLIVVLLVLLILIKICISKFQFVSFWNHVDSIRFYLKIRLTKILHYEVFKVQRTFSLPGNPVCLPVLCYVFVGRNVIYYTIASLNCQQLFGFLIKLFSPFSFGICTPQALLFAFTILRQLYYNNTLVLRCQPLFLNIFQLILESVKTTKI